ncbi:OmpH family outer membrane protein [Candidatus Rariloculus sp.]|uniref:OmpH family outer membrane protein n=1 Tax=Candidatus Rariloculus sp. TaxID=3101265 RepID=UPI003D09E617
MMRIQGKWRVLSRVALLAVAFAAVNAVAQESLKVGVVNVGILLEQAPQTQEAMTALEAEFAPRQRDLVAMQTSLQEKNETYQRDASVMGEEERVSLERQIRDEQRDLQRENTELNEDFNLRRNEELGNLQRLLLQEVQAYARDADYDLVVADVLYYSTGVDITADVLATIQANFLQPSSGE